MKICIDCKRPFDPSNPKSSFVRGPVCHQKSLDSWTLPEEVNQVAEIIKHKKHAVFLVGGSVRDFLMGRKIKDYDLVTDAKTSELEQMFPNALEVGKQFGVVKVPVPGDVVEIATFREDGVYSDGRRPDYIKEGTLETDVQRRDFTINGLLMDINEKNIIDKTGGLDDLKNQLIRCIGNPDERFKEDYLRMLRAFRFATVLDFKIEDKTLESILNNKENIRYMAKERVATELDKIFSSDNFKNKLELFKQSKILNYCYDHLSEQEHESILNKLATIPNLDNKYVVYSYYFKKDVKLMNQTYKITLQEAKIVETYTSIEEKLLNYESLSVGEKNKCLSQGLFGEVRKYSQSKYLAQVDKDYENLQLNPINLSLCTTGKELIEMGLTQGKKWEK